MHFASKMYMAATALSLQQVTVNAWSHHDIPGVSKICRVIGYCGIAPYEKIEFQRNYAFKTTKDGSEKWKVTLPRNDEILKKRVGMILRDGKSFEKVKYRLSHNGKTLREKYTPKSDMDGHFRDELYLSIDEINFTGDGDSLQVTALLDKDDHREFIGRINLESNNGVMLVSDIDDTIKDTRVKSLPKMIYNTLIDKFKPIPGMPELYKKWHDNGNINAFHFLSGSPYNLYSLLDTFLQREHFPIGSMWLTRYKDLFHDKLSFKVEKFLSSLLGIGEDKSFKGNALEQMLKDFPNRKFVLVGDSGEHDPEIYAKIMRKYENRILCIFIKNAPEVANDEDVSVEKLNKTFAGIDRKKWFVFDESSQLD
eukprot:Pgem_evm1s13998